MHVRKVFKFQVEKSGANESNSLWYLKLRQLVHIHLFVLILSFLIQPDLCILKLHHKSVSILKKVNALASLGSNKHNIWIHWFLILSVLVAQWQYFLPLPLSILFLNPSNKPQQKYILQHADTYDPALNPAVKMLVKHSPISHSNNLPMLTHPP